MFTLSCIGASGTASTSTTVTVGSAGDPAQASFTRQTIGTDRAPWGKGLGDLDGDGKADVVLGFNGGAVIWYRSSDSQRFQISASNGGNDLQIADINGDGFLDVVSNGSGAIAWFENPRGSGASPTGSWTRHIVDGTRESHDLVIGDVNADGKSDIVTRGASNAGATHLYLQGASADTWTRIAMTNAPDGEGTALGDIDRDGRIDIVSNGYWLQQPASNITNGAAWTRRNYTTGAPPLSSIVVHDINGDGRLDIFMATSESGIGKISWYEAPVDPLNTNWTRHDIDGGDVQDVHRFHVVDINGDGKPDVVMAEMHQSAGHRVAVYYNHGLGAAWTRQIVSTVGAHNVAIGDYDGDGDIDLLGANWDTAAPDGGVVNLWRNDGAGNTTLSLTNWTYIQADGSRADSPPAFGLTFGDLDGDGRSDIISGRYWYRNPGGDLAGAWQRTDFGAGNDAMLVLDVDGDGQLDVITQGAPGTAGVPVRWLKPTSAAATAFTTVQIGSVPSDPADGRSQGYAAGVINAGGRPALVFGSLGLFYFQIPASPSSTPWTRVRIAGDAREEGLALADMDGDGDLDAVALVAPAGTSVAWWENPGNGGADWTRRTIGATSGIEGDRVTVRDLNEDGRPDVIVTEANNSDTAANSVFWFANPGNPTSAGQWARATIGSGYGSMNSMDAADLDRDRRVDVIVGEHRGPKRVVIFRNTGGGWTPNIISTGRDTHLGTRLIDLDGDGDLDIVGIAFDNSQFLHVWRNNAH